MAIRRWTGATSGTVNLAGNFDDGNGGAGGIPVAGDDVYYTYGAVDCDAGLATLAAVALGSLTISEDYTGTIGGSVAGYLQFQAGDVFINSHSSSDHYLQPTVNASDLLMVLSAQGGIHLKGTIPRLHLLDGVVTLTTVACGTELLIGPAPAVTIISDCTINGCAISVTGGSISCAAAHGTMTMRGGTWTQTDGNGGATIMWGGTYKPNSKQDTFTSIACHAGYVDCSECPDPRTITDLSLDGSGAVDLDNGAANIIVTNGIVFNGGSINFPKGVRIAMTDLEY